MIKKKIDHIHLFSTIICLMPGLLITGPFLSDLFLSLLVISFLFLSFKNFKVFKKYYDNTFSKFFFFFWVILILSTLFSDNIMLSIKNSFFYFRFGIFSLCVWYVLDNNRYLLKYFYYSLLFYFIILILDGFYQFKTGFNILGFVYQSPRVSSFFGDELILGSYFARLYPLLVGFTLYNYLKNQSSKINLIFISLIFIAVDVMVFLSGERASFLYLNISLIVFVVLSSNFKLLRFFSFIISITIIFFISSVDKKPIERMYNQTIQDIQFKRDKFFFSRSHQEIYISSLKMFKDNIFFGVGPKNYRNQCNKEKYFVDRKYYKQNSQLEITKKISACSTHSHHTYIQLLAETGLFGFTFVIFVFLLICRNLFKHCYHRYLNNKKIYSDFQICLFICLIITLFPFSPTGNFFNNWLSIVYYIPVGFLLWSFDEKTSKTKPIK